MKKMKLIAALCCALVCACTIMVGCQPKNDPQTPTTPTDPATPTNPKPAAAVLNYTFEVTDEMREVADFNISYYDNEGKLQTEKLASNKWNKIMQTALPGKLGVQIYTALKADFDSTKYDVLTILDRYNYNAYCVDAEGKEIEKGQDGYKNSTLPVVSGKIEGYINKYSNKPFHQTLYSVDADGNFTYLSEWE